jgi:hypothetical protein
MSTGRKPPELPGIPNQTIIKWMKFMAQEDRPRRRLKILASQRETL